MKIIFNLKGGLAIFFGLVTLSGTVFAACTIRDPIVKNSDATAVVPNAIIQVIDGPTKSIAGSPYYSGTLRASGTADNGVWQTSTVIQDGSSFFMKGWSAAPGLGKYYGFSGGFSVGTAKDTFDANNVLIKLDYKAAAPYQPYISSIAEKSDQTYDALGNKGAAKTNLIISSKPGAVNDGNRELASVDWWWGTDNPPTTLVAGAGDALTLDSSRLASNTTYYFRTLYRGVFGDSQPSGIVSYSLGTGGGGGGGGGGVTSLTVTLRKATDGFGVNSVGIPFDPPFDVYNAGETEKLGSQVSTLGELIKTINKTEAKVTAASFWDARVQKLRGVAYESQQEKYLTEDTATYPSIITSPNNVISTDDSNPMSGKFAPAGWNLAAGRGYYISVDKEVTIILKK